MHVQHVAREGFTQVVHFQLAQRVRQVNVERASERPSKGWCRKRLSSGTRNKVHEAVRLAERQWHKKLIALADELLARWEKNKTKCGTMEGIARVL